VSLVSLLGTLYLMHALMLQKLNKMLKYNELEHLYADIRVISY